MTKNTYIGLTIGPIINTLQSARKTGELWGASYIFSYIMKKISKRIVDEVCKDGEFIIPYVEDEIFTDNNTIGLFHDSLIFKSKVGDSQKLSAIIDEELNKISKNISELIVKDFDRVRVFIKDYFKIYFVEVELEEKDNIILEVSKYLDAIELREKFVIHEENGQNYLFSLFSNDNIKKSFLSQDAFGKNPIWKDKYKYPSLVEIGASELGLEISKDTEITTYEDLKKLLGEEKLKKLRKAHKYVAIVQADGDNMGKIIKKLRLREDYKEFSKILFDFAKKANEIIKEYDGFTIYAGGDDLLFFAPVVIEFKDKNKSGKKTIFNLLDDISAIFDGYFKDKYEVKPTLSFGVAMAHYKYPLYEFLEETRKLLFVDAKECKLGEKEKNAVAFRVIKHSGQYFGNTFNKTSDVYKLFKEVLKENNNNDESKFLHAMQNKILDDKVIISNICNDEEKLKNYFYNNFNEDIHKENKAIKKYLESVQELILEAGKESKLKEIKQDEPYGYNNYVINQVYSYLKFLRFINEKEKNNE